MKYSNSSDVIFGSFISLILNRMLLLTEVISVQLLLQFCEQIYQSVQILITYDVQAVYNYSSFILPPYP